MKAVWGIDMKKIERPDHHQVALPGDFDLWWSHHVEPVNEMLDKAKRVYGAQYPIGSKQWNYQYGQAKGHTHQAYLINIEPIKQDTAEDSALKILHDILQDWYDNQIVLTEKHLDRAKAILEKGDE